MVSYLYLRILYFRTGEIKRDFVIGNQEATLKAASSFEKDFFKLLNNSNFGIDCGNNIDSCILEPLYDDLNEVSYIKKFTTIFTENTFRYFFHLDILEKK